MKIYNALIKKSEEGKIQDIILLKEGFSFLAFFFSGLWFLYHKMWREFLALIIINVLFSIFGDFWSATDRIFLEFALLIVIALNANYWLCEELRRKNYEFAGLVFGKDQEDAILRFTKNINQVDFENLEEKCSKNSQNS